jgi:hypothetical protein
MNPSLNMFSDKFREDAAAVLSIPMETYEKLAKFYSDSENYNPFEGFILPESEEEVARKCLSLFSYVFSAYSDLTLFYDDLKKSKFDEEQIDKFKKIINFLTEKGIAQLLIIHAKNQKTLRFSYPLLEKLNITTDFRFLYGKDEKRILYPFTAIRIDLLKGEKPLIFECSISQIDRLISDLTEYRRTLDQEFALITDKGLAVGI